MEFKFFIEEADVNPVGYAPASLFNPVSAELNAFVDLLLILKVFELLGILLNQFLTIGDLELECLLSSLSVPLEFPLTPHVFDRAPDCDSEVYYYVETSESHEYPA